jgi:hypothetical protein
MLSAVLLLLSFRCVALFNAWNSIQQLMIRINAVKRSVAPIQSGSKDVKEDLKRNSLHPLKKYQSNRIVRESQRDSFGTTNLRIDLHMWEQSRYFARPNE